MGGLEAYSHAAEGIRDMAASALQRVEVISEIMTNTMGFLMGETWQNMTKHDKASQNNMQKHIIYIYICTRKVMCIYIYNISMICDIFFHLILWPKLCVNLPEWRWWLNSWWPSTSLIYQLYSVFALQPEIAAQGDCRWQPHQLERTRCISAAATDAKLEGQLAADELYIVGSVTIDFPRNSMISMIEMMTPHLFAAWKMGAGSSIWKEVDRAPSRSTGRLVEPFHAVA